MHPKTLVDTTDEAIHWDLRKSLSYSSYLDLDALLQCQKPRSASHEEMLFIVVHQSAELWLKLCLHEVTAALGCLQKDDIESAMKMLVRVQKTLAHLVGSWEVLSTLTPADYVSFREALGTGSGFQSFQYRRLEFLLGNKNAAMIEVHRHNPEHFALLETTLATPSLYDEVLALLINRGFALPEALRTRDGRAPYVASPEVEAAWLAVYRDTKKYWDLYYLAEKLVDIEDTFHQWRFRHVKTVERVMGFKTGTGGSSGVPYLQKALSLKFFPELWSVRTAL
jgi:tryptophan 2,3-dioxygenase